MDEAKLAEAFGLRDHDVKPFEKPKSFKIPELSGDLKDPVAYETWLDGLKLAIKEYGFDVFLKFSKEEYVEMFHEDKKKAAGQQYDAAQADLATTIFASLGESKKGLGSTALKGAFTLLKEVQLLASVGRAGKSGGSIMTVLEMLQLPLASFDMDMILFLRNLEEVARESSALGAEVSPIMILAALKKGIEYVS